MAAKNTPKKSLEDFRSAHDKNFLVPKKIKEALDALGDGWEYESDFVKTSGVSTIDFSRFREQFSDYYVDLPNTPPTRGKRVWAGTKALATKMREMV